MKKSLMMIPVLGAALLACGGATWVRKNFTATTWSNLTAGAKYEATFSGASGNLEGNFDFNRTQKYQMSFVITLTSGMINVIVNGITTYTLPGSINGTVTNFDLYASSVDPANAKVVFAFSNASGTLTVTHQRVAYL
ncbi:MAG: hypothetical protein LBR37_01685 [Erysipelotrichaceae bacterium]|jgi:hypothetical protein|nr:hypothetical protein [Erysipelotrichaceae bacterium]